MTTTLIVSDAGTATHVVRQLRALGHRADDSPDVPGLVSVDLTDPLDAPTVHRIAAMIDRSGACRAATA